jgi:hypothetical protein
MRSRRAFTRQERLIQIIQVVATLENEGQPECTTADIANRLGVTPSTKLRALINSLLVQKVLTHRLEDHAGIANFRRLYRLHPDYVLMVSKSPKKGNSVQNRIIKINSQRGSSYEVMK